MPLDSLSFSGLDSLIANKYKSIEQVKAEKAAARDKKLKTLGVQGTVLEQYDTDTYNVQLPDGTTQVVRAAGIDSPDAYFADNAAAQKKKQQQKYAYNQISGVPVDQIQDSDLAAWKNSVDAQSANQGFSAGSEITYIPTGEASKLEGDTRLIADIYNKDQQNLGDLFDTPETNAAYSAPWNRAERRATANQELLETTARREKYGHEYKSGWDAEGNAVTVQQDDGWFTTGDINGLTAAQVDSATRLQKSNKGNWGDPGTIANSVAGALSMFQDELVTAPAYAISALLSGSTNLSTSLQGRANDWNSDPVNSLKGEITEADVQMFGDYNDQIAAYRNDPNTIVSPDLIEFGNSEKMQTLLELDKEVSANRRLYDASVNVGKELREEIYASNLDNHIKTNYDRVYEKDGLLSAGVWLMTNYPMHPVAKVAESLPIMYAALTGLGMVDMYSSRYMKAIEERRKLTGEELTNSELNIAATSIAIAVAAERMGAEVLFNKVPGSDKLVTMLLTQFPKLSKALIPIGKLGLVGTFEGASEAITELGEGYAVEQDIDKIKGADLGYAGTIGVFGGASMKAPGEVVDVFKSNKKKLTEQVTKVENKLATPDTIPLTDTERADIGNKMDKLDIKLDELRENDTQQDDLQFVEDSEFSTEASKIDGKTSLDAFLDKWSVKLGKTPEEILADPRFGDTERNLSNIEKVNQDYDELIAKYPEDTAKFEAKRKSAIENLKALNADTRTTLQKQRHRLLTKKKELRAQLEAGKPNPEALSAKQREALQKQADKLNAGITAKPKPKPDTPEVDTKKEVEATLASTLTQADTAIANSNADSVAKMTPAELIKAGTEIVTVIKALDTSTSEEAVAKLQELETTKAAVISKMKEVSEGNDSKVEADKDTILYSLNSIGNDSAEQNKVITRLLAESDDVVTPQEKVVLTERRDVLVIASELKTLGEVHAEVTTGGGTKKSFDEHFVVANTEKGFNDLETFARRTREKADIFTQALATAMETNTPQYINKETLDVSSETPLDTSKSWRIDPVPSNPLVSILQKEAEYGDKTLQLAIDTVDLAANRETSPVAKRNQAIQTILDGLDSVATPQGKVEDINVNKQEKPNEDSKQKTADIINKLNAPEIVGDQTQSGETTSPETSETTIEGDVVHDIGYTAQGQPLRKYSVDFSTDTPVITNSKGTEVFKADSKNRNLIVGKAEIARKNAVFVPSTDSPKGYIVNRAGKIISGASGKEVYRDGVASTKPRRDAILKEAKSLFGEPTSTPTTKTPDKKEEPISKQKETPVKSAETIALEAEIAKLQAENDKLKAPEVIEPTVGDTTAETALKTKAGFKKRFTEKGLFKNGRIVSFEEFSKLSETTITAAAKTLKVCD